MVLLRVVDTPDGATDRALLACWLEDDGVETELTQLSVDHDGPIAAPTYWRAVVTLAVDTYTDHVHHCMEG